jgi:hypothetical protein
MSAGAGCAPDEAPPDPLDDSDFDDTIPYQDAPGLRVDFRRSHAAAAFFERRIISGHYAKHIHPASCTALAARPNPQDLADIDAYTPRPGRRRHFRIPAEWEARPWDTPDSLMDPVENERLRAAVRFEIARQNLVEKATCHLRRPHTGRKRRDGKITLPGRRSPTLHSSGSEDEAEIPIDNFHRAVAMYRPSDAEV